MELGKECLDCRGLGVGLVVAVTTASHISSSSQNK